MKTLLHVEICGGIGVGKSTLASRLAALIPNSALASEDFESNTLWHRYYKEPAKYVREKNISFLAQHFAELKSADGDVVVADFSTIQDLAYAALLEDLEHEAVMTSVYKHLLQQTLARRLVVRLSTTLDKQLAQIEARGRMEEKLLTPKVLQKLNVELSRHIKLQAHQLDVINVDTSEIDVRTDQTLLIEILNRMRL